MPKIHAGDRAPTFEGHADISTPDAVEPDWSPADQASTETPDEPETARPISRARTRTTRKAKADG